jgi:hypothetical protein
MVTVPLVCLSMGQVKKTAKNNKTHMPVMVQQSLHCWQHLNLLIPAYVVLLQSKVQEFYILNIIYSLFTNNIIYS